MSSHIYLVFSKPPNSVPDSEYQQWYASHVQEIIAGPTFRAAQRYHVQPSGHEPEDLAGYNHLALYEYDGDLQGMQDALQARIDGGEIYLPPWFSQIRFQSWNARALGKRADAAKDT